MSSPKQGPMLRLLSATLLWQLRRDDLCRHLHMPLGDVMKVWAGLLSAGAVSAVPPARSGEHDLVDVAAGLCDRLAPGLVSGAAGEDCGGDMDDEMEQVMAEMREIRAELRQLRGKLLPGKEIGPVQGP